MNKQTVKAVLFDMDGVVTDTDQLHYLVWKEMMKELGIDLTEELYIKHLQSTSHKKAILSLLGDVSDEEIMRLSREKNKRSKAMLEKEIKIHQDAIDLIQFLNQNGYILAVVSASSNAEFVIRRLNIDQYFDLIVSGTNNSSLRNKPFPDIYLHAMDTLGVKPKETVIVEDSVSGITAGLQSGAFVYGINRGNLRIEKQEHLKVIVDLHEVIKDLE